jgi:TPP-dependent pyruvate/acetoin dehydrogenase alpha subunit
VARAELLENGWAGESDLEQWHAQAAAEIEEAVAIAQKEAGPDPAMEDWCGLASKHLAEGREQAR